ncbi:MAG TPA: NAD(+) synthase [Coleofasciculaceae cyanobacterium]|jgi:NH3-dependent NAD+ synthetase/predicted amidohydrolase
MIVTRRRDSVFNPLKQKSLIRPQAGGLPLRRADSVNLRFGFRQNSLLNTELTLAQFQMTAANVVEEAKRNPEHRADGIASLTEVLDQFLQAHWNEQTQPGKKDVILKHLADLLGKRGQGNMVMAQMNPVLGDLEGNSRRVLAQIDAAEKIGADLIVFPELTLMGYPPRDIIGRHPFLVDENVEWLKAIAARTGKTRAVVGFVEPRKAAPGEKAIGKSYFNSLVVLGEGRIKGIVRKSLLPTYAEFNDDRQFERAPASGLQPPESLGQASWGFDKPAESGTPVNVHGHTYGISVCEDIWNDLADKRPTEEQRNQLEFFARNLYTRDIMAEAAAHNPEVFINSSASPSRSRKEPLKDNMLPHFSTLYRKPVIYVNQVGAIDEHSYDGSSRAYNADGQLIARSKSFEEQFQIINPLWGEGKIYPLAPGLSDSKDKQVSKVFDPDDESDLGRTYHTIIQSLRDYFKKTGHTRAVLGLSGGLDSTIAAVLLADALGPENVLGVTMPSKISDTSSRADAEILAKNLGIHVTNSGIARMVNVACKTLEALLGGPLHGAEPKTRWEKFKQQIGKFMTWPFRKLWNTALGTMPKSWGERIKESTTLGNIQARLRALVLWSITNEYKGTLPIATSDKSELYMGYATINGDMSGGFAPIADVTKTKLFALGRWMNQNRSVKNAIPAVILAKPPGAELEIDPETGKPITAEKANMPYPFMDEIIWRLENKGESYQDMLKSPFWYEQKHEVPPEQKRIWLDRFYRKMAAAVFKWTLLPPGPIVDSRGINKIDYQQPITAKVRYQGHTPAEIKKVLDNVYTTA